MTSTPSSLGTTPLPLTSAGSPVRIHFQEQNCQAAQAIQVSTFPAKCGPLNASLLSSNRKFVVYAVKNGLLRILSDDGQCKALMRGHAGQTVTDIQFFNQADVVCSAGSQNGGMTSSLIVSRVSRQGSEIRVEILLEFRTQAFSISRAVWHPFDMNQLCMIHTNAQGLVVGTLLNTNAIRFILDEKDGHNLCLFASDYTIQDGAVQIADTAGGNLTDFTWGPAERHVLSTYSSGKIVLHDWKMAEPTALVTLQEDGAVTRCLFLPPATATTDETCWTPPFLTASGNNATITLWSAFTSDGKAPTKLQVFGLENPAESYVLDFCSLSGGSTMLVQGDRTAGKIYAWHLDRSTGKCNYVVPFSCKYATYSWDVQTEASSEQEDGSFGMDIQLHAYQSTAVQKLTLTSVMLLPPMSTWVDPTPGVRVERLWDVHSAHVSDIGSDADILQYDEDYDLPEDDEEQEGQYEDAPDPSALPTPEGLLAATMSTAKPTSSSNPFSNWLGNLAAKSSSSAPAAVKAAPPPAPPIVPPVVVDPAILAALPPNEPDPVALPPNEPDPVIVPPPAADLPPPPGVAIARGPTPPVSNVSRSLPQATALPPPAPKTGTVNADVIVEQVRQAIRDEMKSMLIPSVQRAVESSVQDSIIRPIQTSIAELAKTGVQVDHDKLSTSLASSVDAPLRAAFANNMKTALVPALESMMGQVLEQVSHRLEAQSAESQNNNGSKELEAMSAQLSKMTNLVASLTKEFQALKETVAKQAVTVDQTRSHAPAVPAAQKTPENIRNEIIQLNEKGAYNEAFNLALSKADARYTLFCCENANFDDIFGGESTKVNQVILLCIMQHLAQIVRTTVVDAQLDLALKWLQEIALSMNPPAREIREHLPNVLIELARNINGRMEQGDQVRRHRDFNRLLQFVRGIQY